MVSGVPANGESIDDLLQAVARGELPQVQALVDAGAPVNGRGAFGLTPLALAAREGQTSIAQFLLFSGADVNLIIQGGYTPLMLASMHGYVEIVDALIAGGATGGPTNAQGLTAFLEAAEAGQTAVVRLLIKRGLADSSSDDPLHSALLRSARMGSRGQAETLQALIDAGADIHKKSKAGDTPLAVAAFFGHKDAVGVLLRNGATANSTTASGLTPLMAAAMNGSTGPIEILLTNGADINARRPDGATALMIAAQGSPHVVRLLLTNGADASLRDNSGRTALTLATRAQDNASAAAIRVQGGTRPTTANPLALCLIQSINIKTESREAMSQLDEFRRLLQNRGFEACGGAECKPADATLHVDCKPSESQWSIAVSGETAVQGSPGVMCEYSLRTADGDVWHLEREGNVNEAMNRLEKDWIRSKARDCK